MKTCFTTLPGFGRVFRNWAFLLVSLLLPALSQAQAPTVVISEVYAGGGTTSGVFTNDFVELYNTTGNAISLAGYSLQYKGATATTAYMMVAPLGTLTGSIPANGYYLVQLGSSGTASTALPTADAVGTTSISATAGRIALVSNTTPLPNGSAANAAGVIDFVGYGAAAATSEGGSPALGISNTISIERKARATSTSATMGAGGDDANQGNGYDSNNNGTDFVTRAAPEPQNSASAAEVLVPTTVYYNTKVPGGNLDELATYSATLDGTGASPASFSTPFQLFYISGTGNTIAGNLTLAVPGSRAVLQSSADFTVPATANFTGMLDLASGATLVELNAAPAVTFGSVDAASTVEFAQAGTYTVPVLAGPGYGNMTLRNATKRLDVGTTVVRGNLLVNNVGAAGSDVFGGAAGSVSVLSLGGNLTLAGTVGFSTADDRISLLATNTGTAQILNGGGNTIKLFKLTLPTGQMGLSLANGTSNLELGNATTAGGGYALATGTVLAVGNNTLSFATGSKAVITNTAGELALSPGSSLVFSKNNTAAIGTLRLTAGSTQLTNLTVDLDGNNNTLVLPASLTVSGTLALVTGTLTIGPGNALTLNGPITNGGGILRGASDSDLAIGGTGALGTLNIANNLSNFTLNRSGATLTLITSNLTVGNAITLTSGTLDISNNRTLTVNGSITTTPTGLLNGSSGSIVRIGAGNGAPGTVRFTPTGGVLSALSLDRAGQTLAIEGNALQVNTLTLTNGILSLGADVALTNSGALVTNPATTQFAVTPTSILNLTGTGAIGALSFVPGQDQLDGFTLSRTGTVNTVPTGQLLTNLTVRSLNLNGGRLFVQGNAKLTVLPTGGFTGGGTLSYVNTLTQSSVTNLTTSTRALSFPLGADGQYRNLTLTVTDQTIGTTAYTAHQYEAPSPVRTLPASLARVSQIRYYNVVAEAGGTSTLGSATIRLMYNAANDRVTTANQNLLRIAMTDPTDATRWKNIGGAGGGTDITSDPFPAGPLGDFTLATDILTPINTNPLPVELVRFEAVRQATGVNVTWATATEKSSDYFDVQRSLDGREFATVATATAGGNTTQPTAYAALDKTAPLARLYYRLRQVDLDGTFAYSPVVTVAGSGASVELVLYPNPATDRLTATLPASEGRTYRVLNSVGQVLAHGSAALADPVVDVRSLPAGTYFLELRTEAGQQTRRFVKYD